MHSYKIRCMMVITFVLLSVLGAMNVGAEKTKVVFYFRDGSSGQKQTVDAWITEFETKNPDIDIEWQIPPGDWQTKLPIMVASGMGPDVFELWGVNGVSWGENGVALDLAPYVARDFTDKQIKDYFPASWNATEIGWGPKKGVRYGLPSNGNLFIMYYNKDKFDQAGVPYISTLDRQGVWNWDTFVSVGKKLTIRDANNKITQWALDTDCLAAPTGRGAGWVRAAGGNYFDIPNNPNKYIGNQPAAIAGLTFMQDLIWKYEVMSPIATRGQASFAQNKAAMNLYFGTAMLAAQDRNLTFNWDLGPRPKGPVSRGYEISADMFGINSASKVKEAAWRFLKYLTSTDGQLVYSRQMGRAPTLRSAFPEFRTLFPKRNIDYIINGLTEGEIFPVTFMNVNANNLIHKTIVEQIAPNAKPPLQAMNEIAEAVNALVQ